MIKEHTLPKHCDKCGMKLIAHELPKVIDGYNKRNGKPLYKYTYSVECPNYSKQFILNKILFNNGHLNKIIDYYDSPYYDSLGVKYTSISKIWKG